MNNDLVGLLASLIPVPQVRLQPQCGLLSCPRLVLAAACRRAMGCG